VGNGVNDWREKVKGSKEKGKNWREGQEDWFTRSEV